MKYPTISYRDYISKFAFQTLGGEFFCWKCGLWINKHRWLHFKVFHRYISGKAGGKEHCLILASAFSFLSDPPAPQTYFYAD